MLILAKTFTPILLGILLLAEVSLGKPADSGEEERFYHPRVFQEIDPFVDRFIYYDSLFTRSLAGDTVIGRAGRCTSPKTSDCRAIRDVI